MVAGAGPWDLMAHISNCKQESEKANWGWGWAEAFTSESPSPSGILPPGRPPKLAKHSAKQPIGDKVFKCLSLWETYSFRAQQWLLQISKISIPIY